MRAVCDKDATRLRPQPRGDWTSTTRHTRVHGLDHSRAAVGVALQLAGDAALACRVVHKHAVLHAQSQEETCCMQGCMCGRQAWAALLDMLTLG